MRRALIVGLLLAASSGCSSHPSRFSVDNAYAHIRMLAGTIGSRPTGTEANRRAREYVVQQLRAAGFRVRVAETDAVRPVTGVTVHVANVIAAVPGSRPDAIALVSHYDSVPDGPGAADDAFAVGACLEAGRVLAARPSAQYTLVVIVTDAEELGLMGARAVAKDPIMARVRAVLNFEAVGSGGPDLLFQAAPGSADLVGAWARAAPQPAGASYHDEIYRRLPNDTDFTVFLRAGVAGLNFASVGDGYSYHTTRDTVERLDPAVVRQRGENIVATVEAIDAQPELPAPRRPSGAASGLVERARATFYFDVLQAKAFAYGWRGALALLAAALLAALFGWLTILPVARAEGGAGRMLLTLVWAFLGAAAVFCAMTGAAWLLRATRESYQPWYAHPHRFFVYLALAGILAGWAIVRIGRWLPRAVRGSTQPAVTWAITLPFWSVLAVVAQLRAPAAAYLASLPLLGAGLALTLAPVRRPAGLRVASAIALGIACACWLPNAVLLLDFAVTVFGRLPIVTPLFVYPGLMLACGLFAVPPALALVGQVEWRSWRRAEQDWHVRFIGPGAALAGAVVVAAAWCWFAPAYTDARPLHRQVQYVSDLSANQSWWEMGGNEPAVDVGREAPIAGGWMAGPSTAAAGTPVYPLNERFSFRAAAAIKQAAPVAAEGALSCGADRCTAEIRAIPETSGLIVAFVMPRGVTPLESNLTGSSRADVYRAVYAAAPAGGVLFRATFEASARAALLAGTSVVAIANGVPGAAWPKLPGWLPQQHVAWRARSYFVVPVRFVEGPR